METQACVSCGTNLPLEKFKLRSQGGRQAGQRNTMCNRCLYVRYTRPEAERKTQEIADYKLAMGCVDCGYAKHPNALEFDHRPGTDKKFNIGEKVGSRTRTSIWEEIAKCDVVCANCHAIRTAERRVPVEIPVV